MIEFQRNIEKILPYNRKGYMSYQSGSRMSVKWYGVSFQVAEITDQEDASFQQYLEIYEALFRDLISEFDSDSSWIVTHDFKNLPWFPNEYDNLPDLRALFKQNNILSTFTGAVIFSVPELIGYSEDLVSYPYVLPGRKGMFYRDLDISHSQLPAIIRISGHLNIDFISTEQQIFRKIMQANFVKGFVVKEYRGN